MRLNALLDSTAGAAQQQTAQNVRLGATLPVHRSSRPSKNADRRAARAVDRRQKAKHIAAAAADSPAADLEDILKERDACGVGFIANIRQEKSHKIIQDACNAVACMEHRGACSADDVSGDGIGIMAEIPWALLAESFPEVSAGGPYGVGMVFLPNDDDLEAQCEAALEAAAREGGFEVLGWRAVPVEHDAVGRIAKGTQPRIRQIVVKSTEGLTGDALERALYFVRRSCEAKGRALGDLGGQDFYVCSLSTRVIVYKGMLNGTGFARFFKDLQNDAYETSFAIYHRRFSTNTNPRWPLAQPMRFLGHNGEINTLQGNLNWVASRQGDLEHPVLAGHEDVVFPLCSAAESDSANLDHVAELLVQTGTPAEEAMMVLVPEAYRNHPELMEKYPEVVPFYEHFEGLQEGWDGPALLVFSDGKHIGARLDRNGLRPARYWTTEDGMVYMASEVGVLGDVFDSASKIAIKGRLGPGQTVLANLETGKVMENEDVIKAVAARRNYAELVTKGVSRLEDAGKSTFPAAPTLEAGAALKLQTAAGMSLEDAQLIVESMAASGVEPTYCMGDDTPLAVLSGRGHMLADYFKQRFAQVTNPPIDPLREGLVMSLEMRLGKRGNLLNPDEGTAHQILLKSPLVTEAELEHIKGQGEAFGTRVFDLTFDQGDKDGLEKAVEKICADVEAAVKDGCEIVVLSDRAGAEAGEPQVPMLLATGAVHHHLIRKGMRSQTSIACETSQCFSTHHVATLVGYGAHAICPYLAYETCRQWHASPRTQKLVKAGKMPNITIEAAQNNFKTATEKGLKKILSKMGISLLSCYHGAQIFEAYGLSREVVDKCFYGSISRIGGMSFAELQEEAVGFWSKAHSSGEELKKLENFGFIQSMRGLEYHANNQEMSKLLHKAVGLGSKDAQPEAYDAYLEHFANAPVHVLRDCLEFKSDREPIAVDEVESVGDIMERFCTGGMSLGAISRETHETIAVAVNRIGGRSNSGEGGEDPVRWLKMDDVDAEGNSPTFPYLRGLENGDTATSKIKQVASGRFGVTPHFLVNADQVEIKIAQGAKPGEGGQLPGKKVSPYIADLRRSKPGVPLISPPPHHDIYSIEDLAQLIWDLHQVNETAKVSVKLVSEAGIGTIASGVAKANADVIQISGHDGGTGASPVSSIKHCGGPVEMGLAEVHTSLTRNELRERVVLRVDGGIRNGRDVMMMALLGGDEFGFGTLAMIATGCIMARVCHTNNCPVGVASQREELRARFPGAPSDLVHFFEFVAQEVREELARLGYRSLDEVIGRTDLLTQSKTKTLEKTAGLDLSFLLQHAERTGLSSDRRKQETHINCPVCLDDEILAKPEIQAAIQSGGDASLDVDIVNVDRAAMGRVGGAIARLHGDRGFPGTIKLNIRGSAGQSFGCFMVGGMDVTLVGEANDYVGKGMAGGVLSIRHPEDVKYAPEDAALVGNTCLYGATGGKLFVNGRAGERFAVRNSLAQTVVEGAGDHCCEYMTGGTVVCLGTVGRNVAAGMTGGVGYFYDPAGNFESRVNKEIVKMQRIPSPAGEAQLKGLLEEHKQRTGSAKAAAILDNWDAEKGKFWQLVPPSEAATPECAPPELQAAVAA
ncbi:unnamed protein product [Pedinophyceae sp. YPF-701]|nr:unnamed protein product [Pedinophyceae sp. YPF-701]